MADSADGTPGVTSEERTFSGKHGEQIFYTTLTPASPRGLVVVAHGLGEHGGRYAHVAKVFTDAGFSVAIPDHLGHGRSGGKRLRIKSFKQFSDDLDTCLLYTSPSPRD